MIHYVVLLGEAEAIGPFETSDAAQAYIASDWQRVEMRVIELYAPAESLEDRAP